MIKLLLYAAVGYLAYRFYRSGAISRRPQQPRQASPRPRAEPGFRPGQIVDAEFSEVDDTRGRRP